MTAFSTFAQQAVTVAPQTKPIDSSATILSRAINYTAVPLTSSYLRKGGTLNIGDENGGGESVFGVCNSMPGSD
jgi:hypothetical protein